ncbi:MAG: hypothetical protein ACJAZO_004001 [Myxococcota bacterium]|jgi:hypothetical protein
MTDTPAEAKVYRTILEGANAIRVWTLARAAMTSPKDLQACLAEAAESLATMQRDCTATLHAAYLEGATSYEDFIGRTRRAQEVVSDRASRLTDYPQLPLSDTVQMVFYGQSPFDSSALDFRGAVFAVSLAVHRTARPQD